MVKIIDLVTKYIIIFLPYRTFSKFCTNLKNLVEFFFILFKQFGMKIINLNLQKELDSKIVYHENLVQILGFLLSSNDNNTGSL